MGSLSRCDSRNGLQLNESPVECDYFGGVFEYINQMLMEEDDRAPLFQDYCALQAAEKYFYDALHKDSASLVDNRNPPDDIRSISAYGEALGRGDFSGSEKSSQVIAGDGRDSEANSAKQDSFQKKNHTRGVGDSCAEERSSKQMASFAPEPDLPDTYDKVLFCRRMNPGFYNESPIDPCEESWDDNEDEKLRSFRNSTVVKRGRPKGGKNRAKAREVIDLSNLLTLCAEAVSNMNMTTAAEILKQIRQHSSPYGDANERLAHFFGNALEARMTGTGSALYHAFAMRRISAAEFLKSYYTYVTACPFQRMSNIYANKSIGREARRATRIHVIDFGIKYGFQWPCFIQGVSLRPGGPPQLKITAIDFPQPGFHPSERLDQTGRHLMNYCKRFDVPFEYNAIAKKWEAIRLEDLNLEGDELVIVNCLYGLNHVLDESASKDSPRDDVLELIKKISPDLFVHGVINGTFNAPFFTTRFRESLHHYSCFFDMLEATIPREDQDRLIYEREVFGREVMNAIACEGSERVLRPETYKQWQVRNSRAGFRQLPLNRELLKEAKVKVCRDYHNYFLLDEDSEWMLQGWKGRVMYALSCWKPIRE